MVHHCIQNSRWFSPDSHTHTFLCSDFSQSLYLFTIPWSYSTCFTSSNSSNLCVSTLINEKSKKKLLIQPLLLYAKPRMPNVKFGKEITKKWIIPHAYFKGAPELAQSPNREKKPSRGGIVTKTVHEAEWESEKSSSGSAKGDFWISSCWSTSCSLRYVCERVWVFISFLFSTRPTWFSSIRLIVPFKHFLRRKVKNQKITQKLSKCPNKTVYAAVAVAVCIW